MSNSIDEAIAALRRSDQRTAFDLLQLYLAQYPNNADAWYWLSEATPEMRRKVEALHRFVELAPDHPRVPMVQLRLNYLEGQLSKLPPDPYVSA
jgi:TolA-binding protein